MVVFFFFFNYFFFNNCINTVNYIPSLLFRCFAGPLSYLELLCTVLLSTFKKDTTLKLYKIATLVEIILILSSEFLTPLPESSCGLMDKAPDFGSGDCRFESCQVRQMSFVMPVSNLGIVLLFHIPPSH